MLLPQPPQVFAVISGLRLISPRWNSGFCVVCHPVHQLLSHWPAAALPTPLHNLPPRWVRQPLPCSESFPPPTRMLISTLPTGLDECFFLISLVVGLPYSLIFCQFWWLFVFKLLFSFWLCEEAQCVYLHLHLDWKSLNRSLLVDY